MVNPFISGGLYPLGRAKALFRGSKGAICEGKAPARVL